MSKKPDDQYSPKGLKEHDGRALEWCAPRWACAHESKEGRQESQSKKEARQMSGPTFRLGTACLVP